MKFFKSKIFALSVGISLVLIIGLITIPTTTPNAELTHGSPIGAPPEKDIPQPSLAANKNKPIDSLLSKEDILSILDKNQYKSKESYIKSLKLRTYKNHIIEDEPGSKEENYEVSPDRMVWVVVTIYPDGLDTGAGFYDNATVTTALDAETGRFIESSVHGVKKTNVIK